MSELEHLRVLLEDVPRRKLETVVGDGISATFSVGAGPILANVTAAIDGSEAVPTWEPGGDDLTFSPAPVAGAMVVFSYTRSTWSDAELAHFLALATEDHDRPVERVYRAATLAVDTLLKGAASALSFGEGGDRFEVADIFDRMSRFRAMLATELARQEARPRIVEPTEPAPAP